MSGRWRGKHCSRSSHLSSPNNDNDPTRQHAQSMTERSLPGPDRSILLAASDVARTTGTCRSSELGHNWRHVLYTTAPPWVVAAAALPAAATAARASVESRWDAVSNINAMTLCVDETATRSAARRVDCGDRASVVTVGRRTSTPGATRVR